MTENTFRLAISALERTHTADFISSNKYFFREMTYFADILDIEFNYGYDGIVAVKGRVEPYDGEPLDKLFVFDFSADKGMIVKTYVDKTEVDKEFMNILCRIPDQNVTMVTYRSFE